MLGRTVNNKNLLRTFPCCLLRTLAEQERVLTKDRVRWGLASQWPGGRFLVQGLVLAHFLFS